METSEDGMTWTVTIRSDVKFTDGEALTAEDVAFTYNTLRDNSTVNDFTMLDEAEATDDTTVVFHMKRPYSICHTPWRSQVSFRNMPMALIMDRTLLVPAVIL